MKKIKFRAWYPYPVDKMTSSDYGSWGKWGDCELSDMDAGDCIMMQFTGLKDKNDKEIYEGDILKDDQGELLEVKFGKLPLNKSGDCVCTYQAFYCKCYGKLGCSPMYDCCEIGDWMEIIGNIHENPDLLK